MVFFSTAVGLFLNTRGSIVILLPRFPAHPLFSTRAVEKSPSKSPFIVKYLINTVGLSAEKAKHAARHISGIKSPSKPNLVIQFLKQSGFGDAQIKSVVFQRTTILRSSVEKTLKPKMKTLLEFGFSESDFVRLVLKFPNVFYIKDMSPKIEFCKRFFGSNDYFLKFLLRDEHFLSASLDKKIMPNISFLLDNGISEEQIVKLMKRFPRLFATSFSFIKQLVDRAKSYGFKQGSPVFYRGLSSICLMSQCTIDSKIKLLISYGWSEDDISKLILEYPDLFTLSEKNIKEKIEFLVKTVGCEISYIVSVPRILTFSLQKRLISRILVMQLSKSEGFRNTKTVLYRAITISDKRFVEEFIEPYKKMMPKLQEVYSAACAGELTTISLLENKLRK